jgi:L-fuconolactonase
VIVDAHHHFWDPDRPDYPWMTDELAPIRRRFGPQDLAPLLARTGTDRTILVQTRSSLEETGEFLATAATTPFVAGVVGWLGITDAGVADAIASLRSGPGGAQLVGIRHQVHDEPDPDWLLRPDVRRGLAAVGAAGLVYGLLVRPRELHAALGVARALPMPGSLSTIWPSRRSATARCSRGPTFSPRLASCQTSPARCPGW